MKIFLLVMMSFLLCGCMVLEEPNQKDQYVLLETEYDIFNLRWGCSSEFVEKNCDFGGKNASKISSGFYKVEFSKNRLLTQFHYNTRDELYSVDMMHYYSETDFAAAVDFFFYLNSILQKKYPDKNNPKEKSNRYTLDGYFKYMHLPASIRFEHFMQGHFYLSTVYETMSSKIDLDVVPWSRPNSFETLPVLVLTYKSKQFRSDVKPLNDSKDLDSKGL